MDNLMEIKDRVDRLTELSKRTKEQFTRLSGPEGETIKKKAKEEGTRIGIGAGMSFFGLMIAAVASVYILAVIILAVNLALDRLWLSALIVVGGFLIIGGIIIAIGAAVVHSSAKELSRSSAELKNQMKRTGEEIKAELEALQKIVKREAEMRQKQVADIVGAKSVAPIAASMVIGVFLTLKIIKKRIRERRERQRILKVIEMHEESKE